MFGGEQRGVRRARSPDEHDGFRNGPPPPQFGRFNAGPGFHHPPHHQQHHGGQQFYKRHRGENYPPQQPQNLEDRIARLGEVGFRNSDIGALVKHISLELSNKSQEEEKTKLLVSKICQCIISFPTRIGTYATLIGLISVKHYNVSCQITNALHASYPIYLEAQKWQEALTIIHLLSSLVNCKVIRPEALLSQFEFLLETTLEDDTPQARSDYYVYTVLSSLPYVALELASQPEKIDKPEKMITSDDQAEPNIKTEEPEKSETQQSLDKILDTIEKYLSKRSKEHLNVVRVWLSDDSTIQMDYLDSLWVQMKNFRANSWNETFIHRPYNDKDYKDTMASSLITTNSPTFQIPGHSDSINYPPPRIVFRVFEDDVAEGHRVIPGCDKIERFCIEKHIRDVIDEISDDPRTCARHLSHFYHSDQLPIKHLLIETILGELFTLPKPKHQEILYQSLLYELTKTFQTSRNPEEMKHNYDVVVHKAVKVLYENLDTMNVTCFTRFVEWFSFHLNNTEFLYPWQSWADAAIKEPGNFKTVFVQDILDRCVRFSFHKKIGTLVQASLSNLMPPETSVIYKPTNSGHPRADELAVTIKKLIVEKANGKEIAQALNLVIDGVEMPEEFVPYEEKHADKLLKIDIFTAVILSIASKSLTHLSSAIGKFRSVFRSLTNVPQGQVQLLQTMNSCMENHPQLQVILVDKLLKAELVEVGEVGLWLFYESMKPHHLKSYPWEILNNTIYQSRFLINKLIDNRKQLDEEPIDTKVEKKTADDGSSTPNADAECDVDIKMEPVQEEPVKDVAQEKEALLEEKKVELDKKIESAHHAHAEMILSIFQMFTQLVDEYIKKCQIKGTSFMDTHFRWITGRMQEVYYKHIDQTKTHYSRIRVIIDGTPALGGSIINLNQ